MSLGSSVVCEEFDLVSESATPVTLGQVRLLSSVGPKGDPVQGPRLLRHDFGLGRPVPVLRPSRDDLEGEEVGSDRSYG